VGSPAPAVVTVAFPSRKQAQGIAAHQMKNKIKFNKRKLEQEQAHTQAQEQEDE
jgi:hypothetical protein